jgi:hypothetical protein
MKQNMLIALAIVIPIIGAPFCLGFAFLMGLSDSGKTTNSDAVKLAIFPIGALLALLSIVLFTKLTRISTGQTVAIIVAAILNFVELLFILSLAGVGGMSVFR